MLFLLGFPVMVFAGVTIIFLPHCVALLSILPWERLTIRRQRAAPPPAPQPRVSTAGG